MHKKKIIIIDNYDSFTYTIKAYFDYLQVQTRVINNDDDCLLHMENLNPDYLVLSPGPGNPSQAGHTLSVIKKYYTRYPMLGICLGHQCIAQAFGAKVIHASRIMHGKLSLISHQGQGLFTQIPHPFNATRYHSLMVDWDSLPPSFTPTAWTYDNDDKVMMAFQHNRYPLFGIQFHPEAVLTEHGHCLLNNFLACL